MKKKILYIITGLICGLMLGYGVPVIAEQNDSLKIWRQNNNGMCSTWNIHDDNTGVEYIVVTTRYSSCVSCAITPRLNADGSLYTSK